MTTTMLILIGYLLAFTLALFVALALCNAAAAGDRVLMAARERRQWFSQDMIDDGHPPRRN